MNDEVESKILARELGKLGGFGARWAAGRLPNVSHTSEFSLNPNLPRITSVLHSLGKPILEFPSNPDVGTFHLVLGSGHLDLNPTIVHVAIHGHQAFVRAVAKEGAIPQHSARKAVERIEEALRGAG